MVIGWTQGELGSWGQVGRRDIRFEHRIGHSVLVTGWEHREVLVIGWMEDGIN